MQCLPMYMQIVQTIRKKLGNGQLQPGDLLPGEFQLAEEFEVSRRTVRKALDVLRDDGFVICRKGVGSSIAPVLMHKRRLHSDIAIIRPADRNEPGNNFFSVFEPGEIDQGVVRALAERGHWLRYIPWYQDDRFYETEAIFQKGIDGFVFTNPPGVRDILTLTAARRLPHIACESTLPIPGLNVIAADEITNACNAVHYLAERGFNRIGFIGGVLKDVRRNTANRRRMEGFLRGMEQCGFAVQADWLRCYTPEIGGVDGAHDTDFVPGAARAMLADPKRRPEVIVASSLDTASLILDAADELGLVIPRDFGMLTFSGAVSMRCLRRRDEVMRLTMYHTDENAMGRKAVELLQEWLLDPTFRPGIHYFPGSFAEGNSLILKG